jgi:hypothetical protein
MDAVVFGKATEILDRLKQVPLVANFSNYLPVSSNSLKLDNNYKIRRINGVWVRSGNQNTGKYVHITNDNGQLLVPQFQGSENYPFKLSDDIIGIFGYGLGSFHECKCYKVSTNTLGPTFITDASMSGSALTGAFLIGNTVYFIRHNTAGDNSAFFKKFTLNLSTMGLTLLSSGNCHNPTFNYPVLGGVLQKPNSTNYYVIVKQFLYEVSDIDTFLTAGTYVNKWYLAKGFEGLATYSYGQPSSSLSDAPNMKVVGDTLFINGAFLPCKLNISTAQITELEFAPTLAAMSAYELPRFISYKGVLFSVAFYNRVISSSTAGYLYATRLYITRCSESGFLIKSFDVGGIGHSTYTMSLEAFSVEEKNSKILAVANTMYTAGTSFEPYARSADITALLEEVLAA